MTVPDTFPRRRIAFAAAVLCLQACNSTGNVAGGSSEVDNPQIKMAFLDGTGAATSFTGSLSVFLADQSPALDPDPLLKKQVEGASSVVFFASDFTGGDPLYTARAYNILLIGKDTLGALLQNLSYSAENRKYTFKDTSGVSEVRVPLVPLVRYEASLDLSNDTGLVRVIVPGTPFHAVLVDSVFVFEGVPGGDSLLLHVLDTDGSEKPLAPSPPDVSKPPHHQIDTTKSPVARPPPPPPPDNLSVDAGEDQTLFSGKNAFLNGKVSGINPKGPVLSVLWKQVTPISQNARATIENPTALKTKVSFPKPGAYRFVLSAVAGTRTAQDTVIVGVEGGSIPASFIEPTENDTLYLGEGFRIVWQVAEPVSASLHLSRDSGATWQSLPGPPPPPRPGFNEWTWHPAGNPAPYCFLRLQGTNGSVIAVSKGFTLRNP